jgi:hypothetical protein
MNITVTLTEAEAKALAYAAVSPQEWVDNAVHERCRIAMEEIFQIEVARMLADPNITEIPADREAVVLASNLPSAAERHEQALLQNESLA